MLTILPGLGGCYARYYTPGGAADFGAMGLDVRESLTDPAVRRASRAQPLADFPANIAVVRVQESGYRGRHCTTYGRGAFTVVVDRDVEEQADFDTIAHLPGVEGVAPLNRLVLPRDLSSERDLRIAAATLRADMLLIYTIDTVFEDDSELQPLNVITLGLFPDRRVRVRSTSSAVLVDVRSGYIYAVAEASADTKQLANAWTSESAVDQSRRRTEREAFEDLVVGFADLWPQILAAYAEPDGRVNAAALPEWTPRR